MDGLVELAVVGAGPAGIEAAVAASQAGVQVTLIDACPKPGGQYFKQIPDTFSQEGQPGQRSKGQRLFQQLIASDVAVLNNTLVWGIFEGPSPDTWCLKLYGPGAPSSLLARRVILAAGAYDRSVPFPGWDLPGVITAGAALTLVKTQGVLPGKRVLLSGTGPLQLAAAATLVRAGAEVIGVCETTPNLLRRSLPYLPAAWGQWDRMGEGVGYIRSLASAKVPYRLGWAVVSASGAEKVQQATIAKLDREGRPVPGTGITCPVDSVVVGYGLSPGAELCRQVDCKLEYASWRGGFVPIRNEEMETSCPGIYAVGDCAGIGGAEMARLEGSIAGYSAACHLGHNHADTALHHISKARVALRREQRFARFLGEVFTPPEGLFTLADPDTVICRCEQVTLRQIREAIAYGAQTASDIKNLARTGMGNCQGRTCGSIIARIMAIETGRTLEEAGCFNIRPPVHPIPLQAIEEAPEEVAAEPQKAPQP